jgi:4-amino-4-deoxy-L-arabinose transferase-like glycosyltransferase
VTPQPSPLGSSLSIACGAVLILAMLALCARSLSLSRQHGFPTYDEVAHIEQARDFAARGGVLPTAACYLRGACTDDKRQPLYGLLLAPFTTGAPRDFAQAKLVSLACALLLVASVFLSSRRLWGDGTALATALAVALSPQAVLLATVVRADALFTALYCASLLALVRWGGRRRGWAAFGFLAGLAYLTKGNGYFLFASALACGLARHRLRFFLRAELYLAAAVFMATASFLLWRNLLVWGNPLQQYNNKAIWLDSAGAFCDLPTRAVWAAVGPRWYFQHHTLWQAGQRLALGLRDVGWTLLKGFAVGTTSYPGWLLSALGMAGLALAGIRDRWRSGAREEVIAPAAAGGALLAAFAWATPATGANLRYIFPIAVSFLPFAALGARSWLGPSLTRRLSPQRARGLGLAAAAAVCALSCWPARNGLAADPRRYWEVPQHWAATSRWIQEHVDPAGFLIDYISTYSTWDRCRDLRRVYTFSSPDAQIADFLRRNGIHHVLVDRDTARQEPAPAQAKYGRHDEYGPVSFLGWPRCFHDTLKPSTYLIYSAARP